jgi:hypothetical protein
MVIFGNILYWVFAYFLSIEEGLSFNIEWWLLFGLGDTLTTAALIIAMLNTRKRLFTFYE